MTNRPVIVCVDDETIVVNALKEQLQQMFLDEVLIEVAESGEEALEILDELAEDGYEVPVVIADYIMPGMRGDIFLGKVYEKNPGSRNIMLTGQASIEGVSNAVNKANLYRYVSKPWDKDDLKLTIKEALKSYYQEKTIVLQNEQLSELNINLEKIVEQRTLELKELNATKDRFFSIIAHDLKNPFNTLIGFSELLKDNFDSFDTDQIKNYITIIFETSRSSYSLLENLLNWSRSQTGRLELTPERISVKQLVGEVLDVCRNPAEKKNIVIHNAIDPEAEVYADYNTTSTVLRNLISNAIKFTHNQGEIYIECFYKDDFVIVSVKDNGVGIPSKNMDKLFRIDGNFSTKGTENESGTGLGLILCREFIVKNGGDIWVESLPGNGSTFYFSLPKKAKT